MYTGSKNYKYGKNMLSFIYENDTSNILSTHSIMPGHTTGPE